MMKSGLFLSAAVAVAAGSSDLHLASTTDRVLRINTEDTASISAYAAEKAMNLLSEMDVWGTAADGSLEVRVPADMANVFSEQLRLNVTDSTEEHLEHFRWMEENRETQVCTKDAETCANDDDFYTRYQLLPAVHERMDQTARTYPNLVTGKSWGSSYEGRDQRGVILSGQGSNKPVVFYFCGEHAREWLPVMFCSYMIENLASRYGSDPEVTRLMDTVEFHVLPVMNVDGYTFSHTPFNNMWRKSRKPNQGSSCIGTDLNRNYAYRWNSGGSSSNPCSDTFHGTSPFDNLETANLERYAKETPNLLIQTDVHAYGNMWMHPWGWTNQLSQDDRQMLGAGNAVRDAVRGVNGLTFRTGSIANVIYVASGSSCDYFYGEHGITYAYAPEVRGTSFQPAASNIVPSNNELWAGLLAQVNYALNNRE